MKSIELVRQHASIRQLIKRAGHDPSTKNLEMLSHWGKYSCVLCSGFVESIVRTIYGEYLRKKAGTSQVARYASRHIESVQNPKAGKLIEIATAFDPLWGKSLEAFLDDQFRGDAINAVMTNRHLIAHGRNSSITLAQVELYLGKSVEVASFIEGQCGI